MRRARVVPPALALLGVAVVVALVVTVVSHVSPEPAAAASVNLSRTKDNTLYEYVAADGDRSNGAGDRFFAGRTDKGLLRRGVVAFNVAASIPAGSTITSVTLSMNMSRTNLNTARTIELHRLLADWGEGTSNAGQNEGEGIAATTNDATWRHRFYSTVFWSAQGGDFSATVSASQSVGATGTYTWSSPPMVADVQSWLNDASTSFGWLVKGDESVNTTAKRFDSRESTNPPVLTIQYTPPTTATPTPTSTAGTPTPTPGGSPQPMSFSRYSVSCSSSPLSIPSPAWSASRPSTPPAR